MNTSLNLEWDHWMEISKSAIKQAKWKQLSIHELAILRYALSARSKSEFYLFVFQGNEDKRTWLILFKLRQNGLLYFTINNFYNLHHFRNNDWLLERVNEVWNEYLANKPKEM